MAEAAYMLSLERNSDVVRLASYAPLLGKAGNLQWWPDLIYFYNTKVPLSANYYVQKMFGQNQGNVWLSTAFRPASTNIVGSCVRDSTTGDLILKLVSAASGVTLAGIKLAGNGRVQPDALRIVLAGPPESCNTFCQPDVVVPKAGAFTAADAFECELPANSFTLLRIKTKPRQD